MGAKKKDGKILIARMQFLSLCNKLTNPPLSTTPSSSFRPAPMCGFWPDASLTNMTAK